MPEPIVLSWSGGKDSSLALAALLADPSVEVVGLMTSVTRGYERISIHGVRRSLLDSQARSLGLPLFEIELEPACSNDEYEKAVLVVLDRLRVAHPALTRIAFGDLFLADVRAYRETLLARTGMAAHFPLWMTDTTELANQFVADGYQARVVCVDTTQLAPEFAGRAFDRQFLEDLPDSVDLCGERGEFHTFVYDGPVFSATISCRVGEKVLRDERFMYCDILEAPEDREE
ncbi:MAG TPA: diphthine--ammonia ligase [Gemmatimonadaceae bacterium]|nr:diphthine--ammonia ligase [Gemmatimonadaceae bacterium]